MPKEFETRETTQSKKTSSSSNFILGALIGGIAGAVAALLLAPKSGKDLRKTLNTQTGPLMEKTTQLRETVVNKGSEMVSGFVLNKGKINIKSTNVSENESEVNFIPIGSDEKSEPKSISLNHDDIRRKIAEAEKALEEEENKVKL